MNELLEKNQLISIVPQDFKNSNKGKVLNIGKSFLQLSFHTNLKVLNLKSDGNVFFH